jgi:RNA polymerase sigma-70 factor (ECF subfamily)
MANEDVNLLAREAREGNIAAFDQLVRSITPNLRGLFRKRGNCDADELAQQTWTVVVEKFKQWDPNRDIKPWLFTIAGHVWVNEQRRRGKNPGLLVADPPGRIDDQSQWLEELERNYKLAECMQGLAQQERDMIYSHYWEQVSLKVLAERMDILYGRLKGLIDRTRERLRRCLERKGVKNLKPDASAVRTTSYTLGEGLRGDE